MPDEPGRELLQRFVHGDREAFEALFRSYQHEVFRWALRIVRDRSTADDALVDAFWRAFRSRARFDPSRSFGAWMRRITTRVAIEWGLWNMLHLALRSRVRWSIGAHGAVLPLVLMPAGVALARALDVFDIQWQFALPMVPIAMTLYYLAWKYVVGFLNEEVGIA
jgi:hypothetical protein